MSSPAAVFSWTADIETVHQRGLWADAVDRFRKNRAASGSLGFIVFLLLLSIVGPFISPWPYTFQDLSIATQAPSWAHWFGTDSLGRDYLTRVLVGGRTAFVIAIFVTTVSTSVGVVVGAVSAYAGGWVDYVVMRITDVIMSFPHLLLAMFVVGMLRNPIVAWMIGMYGVTRNPVFKDTVVVDFVIVFGAIAVVSWPYVARLVRGQVLSLSRTEFIEAERAIGAPVWLIIKDHLVPNALGPVVVSVSVNMGSAMLLESSLSFLGIGIEPPGASWGNMISETLATWRYYPHLLAAPGIVLALAIIGFNFVGDGINDALNPRRGQQ
jgi:peptide/nickel transport system permease protein